MRSLFLALFMLSTAVSGCGTPEPTKLPAASAEPDDVLGPGDMFEVRVFGQEDLSGSYRVGSDGSIQFPFLGKLQVGGREPHVLAAEIAAGLRQGDYLKNPQVVVHITESNSRRITVLGAVAKPGTFALVPGMTVIQAVSQAGGFTQLASKDDTVVSRRVGGKLERYRVTLSDVSRGRADDFPLRAGDIVFVPERVF